MKIKFKKSCDYFSKEVKSQIRKDLRKEHKEFDTSCYTLKGNDYYITAEWYDGVFYVESYYKINTYSRA